MASKTVTVCIVAFWAVMMTALVRTEYFPAPSKLHAVPVEQVMRRMFANPDTQQLSVSYQGKLVGRGGLTITPLPVPQVPDAQGDAAYKMDLWLVLRLQVLGIPSRFRLDSVSWFDRNYALRKYDLSTSVGESRVEIHGDNQAKKLAMDFDLGDGPQSKQFDYAQLNDPSALQTLGLPGLPGLAGLALPANGAQQVLPVIRASEDRIEIGGARQRAYVIEARSDQTPGLWLKAWIDDQGNLLIVDTSAGLKVMATSMDSVASRPSDSKVISQPRRLQ